MAKLLDRYDSRDALVRDIAPKVGPDIAANIPDSNAYNIMRKMGLGTKTIVSIYINAMSMDVCKRKYKMTPEENYDSIKKKLGLIADFNVSSDKVNPLWFDNNGVYSNIMRFTKRIAKEASIKNRSPRKNQVTYTPDID